MYKVHIHHSELIFQTSHELNANTSIAFYNDFEWSSVYEQLKNSPFPLKYVVFHESPEEAFDDFSENFLVIKAAGGIVQNEHNQVLMIHRLSKWDLPKGKMEEGENEIATALREVEEECGIANLQITNPHPSITFHTYEMNNAHILKQTFWFQMRASVNGHLIPQKEEGIDQVKWVSKGDDLQEKLQNTFQNIRNLLAEF
jgi:8-oxo-dGTP pyrophosphatase MutT (NUDIX family)